MQLTRYQRTIMFQALLAEAHTRTARGLTSQDIVRTVEHVKRDLFGAVNQERMVTASPRHTYSLIASSAGQEARTITRLINDQ